MSSIYLKLSGAMAIVILAFFVSCKNNPSTAVEHKLANGVSVHYDESWLPDKSGDENIFLLLFAKNQAGSASVNQHIKMGAFPQVDKKMDFASMVAKNKKYAADNKIELLEGEITEIDGKEAFRVVYNENAGKDKLLQFLQYFNDTLYVLTFTSSAKEFDSYKEEAEEIIRSVHY